MTASLFRFVLCVGLLLAGGSSAQAQRHREPLTQSEIDQIRDASWEPKQRLDALCAVCAGTAGEAGGDAERSQDKDRPQQTHDLLDDFQLLYDELNDNIDTYVDRKDDIRKPLKTVIEADTEFQAKLRALKDAADVPAEEAQQYEFVLTNVLDTVDTAAEDHRKLLADQEEAAKHKKLNTNSSAKSAEKPE